MTFCYEKFEEMGPADLTIVEQQQVTIDTISDHILLFGLLTMTIRKKAQPCLLAQQKDWMVAQGVRSRTVYVFTMSVIAT